MSVEGISAILLALAALITAYVGLAKVKRDAKAQSESESAASVTAHMERQDKSIEKLEKRQDEFVVRERLLSDYVFQLRQHIAEGKPPPPPAWPSTLLNTHHIDDA